MYNKDIRRTAAGSGVKLWQIADALGITDSSFSRKLRKELPQEEKEKIFSIIQKLSQSNGIKSRGGDAKKLNKKEQEVECRWQKGNTNLSPVP